MVIEGKKIADIQKEQRQSWDELTVEEHMEIYLRQGIERKEAMKMIAKDRGVGKREIYQILINKEDI